MLFRAAIERHAMDLGRLHWLLAGRTRERISAAFEDREHESTEWLRRQHLEHHLTDDGLLDPQPLAREAAARRPRVAQGLRAARARIERIAVGHERSVYARAELRASTPADDEHAGHE